MQITTKNIRNYIFVFAQVRKVYFSLENKTERILGNGTIPEAGHCFFRLFDCKLKYLEQDKLVANIKSARLLKERIATTSRLCLTVTLFLVMYCDRKPPYT